MNRWEKAIVVFVYLVLAACAILAMLVGMQH